MRYRFLSATVAAASLFLGTTAMADGSAYKVVVNAGQATQSLTRAQAAALFLKRTTAWEQGGGVVQPVMLSGGPVRDQFCSEVLGKSSAAINTYWTRLVFAGRETPPVEKGSDDEVLAYVRATPGAIGFVSAASSASGVKVITVTP